MGTVLQERPVQNSQNKPCVPYDRPKHKRLGYAPSKKSTKVFLDPPQSTSISLSAETDSWQRVRRTRPDKISIMADPTARRSSRQHNTKSKPHVSSTNEQKERRQRQNSNNGKESKSCGAGLKSSSRKSLSSPSVIVQCEDSSKSKGEDATLQGEHGEDSDNGSDLSDSERCSALPLQIHPPHLNLRAEVIDSFDLKTLRPSCRGHNRFNGSYPDFLPPPFNSWSLKQLAVYLNTDGKGIPRPKPVGQLESYLDRLLQMEWHQIQTVQEESSKSNGPILKSRHHPHTSPHSSLSAPKCILQCQRAFPLALLSSLTNAPTLQLPSCTCPHCQNRYPILNSICRSYAYHHHSRLSPLLEKRGQASGLPKRSSSESRAYQFEQRHGSREHRLSDPLSETSHQRRMQAIGNIRNPVGSTSNLDVFCPVITASTARIGDVKKRRSGQRSRSCAGVREVGYRARGRSEQRKNIEHDSKISGDLSSDGLNSSNNSATNKPNRKLKRVEFVTK